VVRRRTVGRCIVLGTAIYSGTITEGKLSVQVHLLSLEGERGEEMTEEEKGVEQRRKEERRGYGR
jgi:hypothetical protein